MRLSSPTTQLELRKSETSTPRPSSLQAATSAGGGGALGRDALRLSAAPANPSNHGPAASSDAPAASSNAPATASKVPSALLKALSGPANGPSAPAKDPAAPAADPSTRVRELERQNGALQEELGETRRMVATAIRSVASLSEGGTGELDYWLNRFQTLRTVATQAYRSVDLVLNPKTLGLGRRDVPSPGTGTRAATPPAADESVDQRLERLEKENAALVHRLGTARQMYRLSASSFDAQAAGGHGDADYWMSRFDGLRGVAASGLASLQAVLEPGERQIPPAR